MLIGSGLSLVAALLYAAGNVLQKQAVDRLGELSVRRPLATTRRLVSSWTWLAGAAVSVIGIVVQILAFDRVPISVVQSVGVAGTVLLLVASRVHFRESFSAREGIGLALSLAALLMTALSLIGGTSAAGRTADSLGLIIALGATAVIGAVLIVAAERTPSLNDVLFGLASGLFYGLVGLAAKGISTHFASGGFWADVHGTVASPYPYVFIAAWALGIATFQSGIQRGRVGAMGPLSGAVSAVYVLAVGTPIFRETLPSDLRSSVLRVGGFVGVVLGSVLLAWKAREAEVVLSEGGPRTPG